MPGAPYTYQTFVRDPSDLHEGHEAILVLRDLTPGRRKYFAQNVIGVVTREPDPAGQARSLVARSPVGNVFPGPWYVKVVRTLPQRVPGAPYSSVFEAMQAAWGDLVTNLAR